MLQIGNTQKENESPLSGKKLLASQLQCSRLVKTIDRFIFPFERIPTMSETSTPASSPRPSEEFPLVISFLREDIQDVRNEIRFNSERLDKMHTGLNQRIDQSNTELGQRIDQSNQRIDALSRRLDSRFALLLTTMVGLAGVVVATGGVVVAMLRP
jgi:hypothetical protein